jgi:ADP-ribose pyrophosphatase
MESLEGLDMTGTADGVPAGTMQDATLLSTRVLLPKPKRFVHEALKMPDGCEIDWYYVDTPPSVLVVPVTAAGEVVMVRQWRHNLKRHTLEFPAGTVDGDESPERAAERELREETGFTLGPGGKLEKLGAFCSLPSETNKYTHMFLATNVVPAGPATGDAEIEKYFDMSVEVIDRVKVQAWIGDSVIGTESITAFMLAARALDDREFAASKVDEEAVARWNREPE